MEQVVIAGGGPTGLMLACELRLAGVDVLVLERLAEPSGESRAGGIHARTMEILDMRGIIEPFLAEGRRIPGAHFAGIPLGLSGLEEQYQTKYPFLLNILQRRIERLLEARAADLGVRVRREVAVTGLSQTTERVDIQTTHGDLTAEFLVGCDGGRSTVRKLTGIGFPGTPATMTAILGDVELTDPPAEPVFQKRCPQGNYSVLGFEPGWFRVITNDFDSVADRDAPITVDELRDSLLRLAGTDFGLHSPQVDLALQRRRPPGRPLPGRPDPAGRRRRAHPLPGRRPGPQHRGPGRGQPGLETGRRAPRTKRSNPPRHVRDGAPSRGRTRTDQHPCADGADPPRSPDRGATRGAHRAGHDE